MVSLSSEREECGWVPKHARHAVRTLACAATVPSALHRYEVSVAMKADRAADRAFGWMLEMWGYAVAVRAALPTRCAPHRTLRAASFTPENRLQHTPTPLQHNSNTTPTQLQHNSNTLQHLDMPPVGPSPMIMHVANLRKIAQEW